MIAKIKTITARYNGTPPAARFAQPREGRVHFLAAMIARQEHRTTVTRHTKGLTRCDLCAKGKSVGWGIQYEATIKGVTIRWDDGLEHFVKMHKVKPPQKFIDLMMTPIPANKTVAKPKAKAPQPLTFAQITKRDHKIAVDADIDTRTALVEAYNALVAQGASQETLWMIQALLAQRGCEAVEGKAYLTETADVWIFG
jgi:hypothetical protein